MIVERFSHQIIKFALHFVNTVLHFSFTRFQVVEFTLGARSDLLEIAILLLVLLLVFLALLDEEKVLFLQVVTYQHEFFWLREGSRVLVLWVLDNGLNLFHY